MKDVFSKFKSGVYVVTTVIDGVSYGWTSSWCSKVNFEPPIVMVSIGKDKKDHEKFLDSEVFAINVMGEKGLEVARHFGLSSGENVSNFKDVGYIELKTGCPVLKESVGVLDCKVVKTVDFKDHVVFFGEVLDSLSKDGDGLVFSKEVFP